MRNFLLNSLFVSFNIEYWDALLNFSAYENNVFTVKTLLLFIIKRKDNKIANK
jgi:hypothetical protein